MLRSPLLLMMPRNVLRRLGWLCPTLWADGRRIWHNQPEKVSVGARSGSEIAPEVYSLQNSKDIRSDPG